MTFAIPAHMLLPHIASAPTFAANMAPLLGSGHGGVIAVVLKKSFLCYSVSTHFYPSFELQMVKVERDNPLYSILIYLPPGKFLVKFQDFLSSALLFNE